MNSATVPDMIAEQGDAPIHPPNAEQAERRSMPLSANMINASAEDYPPEERGFVGQIPENLPHDVYRDTTGFLTPFSHPMFIDPGYAHHLPRDDDRALPEEPPKDLQSLAATQVDQPPSQEGGAPSTTSSFEVRAMLF